MTSEHKNKDQAKSPTIDKPKESIHTEGNPPSNQQFSEPLQKLKDSMSFDRDVQPITEIMPVPEEPSIASPQMPDEDAPEKVDSKIIKLFSAIKQSCSLELPVIIQEPVEAPIGPASHKISQTSQDTEEDKAAKNTASVEEPQPVEAKQAPEKTRKELIEERDIEFMSSLSQAALEKPTARSQWVVWIILLIIIWLITWANYAELDKIIRGEGKVVPSTKIQVIQNLEGGIVEEIFIHAGDSVKKGQTIIKLDNTQFSSSFDESEIKEAQLNAQVQRLKAEAFKQPFKVKKASPDKRVQALYDREYALYQARRKQHKTNDKIIVEQIEQKKLELNDATSQTQQLSRSLELLREEVNLMQPLVRQGIASQVDLLKLKREENDAYSKLKSVQYSIPKIKSVITEYRAKRIEFKEVFQNEAHEELNQVLAEISQLEKTKMALADRVKRTDIKSPVNGIVKQIFVSTIGGVVQPGSDIVEIVPDDDTLVLETKILPADIGFIYKGLTAKVKFTAYDFAIYGGLDGTVTQLSADTITDEEGNSFYIARIKTERNHLGSPRAPLYLLPGMTASVDVIVGKHTLLNYLLKPIIKARDLALRES
ncbi:MAG: membrane fusion protein, adhesin transport system [Thiomicrorhabdus sp.]|nr:MAG: membrane fusion protein, adhesin transport system [Thiomicrorhabdus sp.]